MPVADGEAGRRQNREWTKVLGSVEGGWVDRWCQLLTLNTVFDRRWRRGVCGCARRIKCGR